jgi:hypothetical protein
MASVITLPTLTVIVITTNCNAAPDVLKSLSCEISLRS